MTEASIAPSAVAYLYGDLLHELYASTSRLSLNETLPCRGTKVKKNDLAALILTTACVYWAGQDCVRLSLGTKGLLVKSRYVLVARTTKPAARLDGVEGLFLAAISGKEKDDGVASIVSRLLRQDSVDPWGNVIKEAQRYLLGLGYFTEGERKGLGKLLGKELVPQCDKIAVIQTQVGPVRDLLAGFRSAQGDLYSQVWKDVGSGIASRQETPDHDLD